jgi:ATP-binding cassette subfamily C protein
MTGDGLLRRTLAEIGRAFGFAALLSLFVNLASLTVPLYDIQLYDRVLLSRSTETLAALSVMCLLGMGLYGVLEYLRSALFLVIGDRLARRLDIATLRAALAQSLAGDAAAAGQALRDINGLRGFAIGGSASMVLDLLWAPLLLWVLFRLHPLYGLYGLCCAVLLLALGIANDRLTRERHAAAGLRLNRALSGMAGALANCELIDGMGLLPGLARRWLAQQDAAQADLDATARTAMLFASASKTLRLLMQGGIIALGVVLVIRHQASPGSMMGANLLVARLLQPFEALVTGWRQWLSQFAALGRVAALLDGHGRLRTGLAWGCGAGGLAVEGLCYTPPGRARPVLSDVSFTVAPGEAVAITGPSASGKSTLARLLVGLAPPSAGAVLFDGRPVHAWDREDFGRLAGYVPQSVALLDGSVFDNIARMGDSDAAPVVEAARKAGIHDMIGRLPQGYDSRVDGDAFFLSGGQRQRIALARALFGQPRLLVMDEPNANLDHFGEQALAEAIRSAKAGGAAVLVVTHRPAVLAAMDTVLVLKDGRLESFPAAAPRLHLAPSPAG